MCQNLYNSILSKMYKCYRFDGLKHLQMLLILKCVHSEGNYSIISHKLGGYHLVWFWYCFIRMSEATILGTKDVN
jgi:hypothetical protein